MSQRVCKIACVAGAWMEAVSARKNGRERGIHARGEEFRRLMRKVRASFWTEGNAFHKIINQPTPVTFCSPSYVFTRIPSHAFFPLFATNQSIAFVEKGHKFGFLYSLFSRNN